tara:strand:+ start:356 stop:532 length:177 start_codon:yes stop_codon:yes gene_type:complete
MNKSEVDSNIKCLKRSKDETSETKSLFFAFLNIPLWVNGKQREQWLSGHSGDSGLAAT